MKTDYFKDCKTVEQIKKLFRQLAMQHHPDRGGDTATMQEINAQYLAALKRADGQTEQGSDGKQHTYRYDAEMEEAIAAKISELLALRMDGVEIALIGLWIWITGNTKPNKAALKAAGCRWHNQRECWYWQNTGYKGHSKGSLEELAAKYGYKEFSEKDKADKRRRIKAVA